MDCQTLRNQLLAGDAESVARAEHLSSCVACAEFARRLEGVRRHLRAPSSPDLAPPPGFAARVVAGLPRGPEILGWAALRALPAALLLAFVLAWMSWVEPPSMDVLLSSEPSTDLLLTMGTLSPEVHP
jgi:hypothetical protein